MAKSLCTAVPRLMVAVCGNGVGHPGGQVAHSSSYAYFSSTSLTHGGVQAEPARINRRTELDFEELRNLQMQGDIALIDVRHPQELEAYGEIPGSLNIPLCQVKVALQLSEEQWQELFQMEKPSKKDRNLVFYARGPNASITALEIAHRLGYTKSRHYTGGWEDYCHQTGEPLKKNQKPSDDYNYSYHQNNFDNFFL